MSKLALLLLLLATHSALSQANSLERIGGSFFPRQPNPPAREPSKPKPTPSTNDFRIHEGKLYNVALSTNWVTIPDALGYRQFIPGMEVVTLSSEGLILQFYDYSYSRPGRPSERIDRIKLVVRNFPGAAALVSGKKIDPFRAIPLSVVTYQGDRIPSFDYGLPNTMEKRRLLK